MAAGIGNKQPAAAVKTQTTSIQKGKSGRVVTFPSGVSFRRRLASVNQTVPSAATASPEGLLS